MTSCSPELLGTDVDETAESGGRLAGVIGAATFVVGLIGLVALAPPDDTAVVDRRAVDQRPSALLDGPLLQSIIESRLATISTPPSALLDGPAFQAAVEAMLDAAA